MIQTATSAKGFSVIVPAKSKVYLPDILDLKDKNIKYIDVCNGVIDKDTKDRSISDFTEIGDTYMNLMEDGTQNLFIKDVCVMNFSPFLKLGEREYVGKKIDMVNSYLENKSGNQVIIFMVFWYEDTELSNIYDPNDTYDIDYCEIAQFDEVTNKCYFPDNRTIVGKQITFFDFNLMGDFITPTNKEVVDSDSKRCCYMNLAKNNYLFVENVPLVCFTTLNLINVIRLQNIIFDLQNSFIAIAPSVMDDVVDKVFFCNVSYKS